MEADMGGVIAADRPQRFQCRQIILVGIVIDIELAHFGGRIYLELQSGPTKGTQRLDGSL
ncbi:MAG: hypothetical protein MO846_08460 [Candidatus Devosia symbiotica]|nr:hypothetical protein [Candidatus Devosia symbiotica]